MTTHSPVSPHGLDHAPAHATAPPVALARAASRAERVSAWTCLLVSPLVFAVVFVIGELLLPESDAATSSAAADAVTVVIWAACLALPLAAFGLSLMDFRSVREPWALVPAVLVLGAATAIEVAAAPAVEAWSTVSWWWFGVAPAMLLVLLGAVVAPRRHG